MLAKSKKGEVLVERNLIKFMPIIHDVLTKFKTFFDFFFMMHLFSPEIRL